LFLLQIEKRLEEACSGKVFVNSRKCQGLLDEQEKLRVKSAQAKVLKDEIIRDLKKYEVAKALESKRYDDAAFLFCLLLDRMSKELIVTAKPKAMNMLLHLSTIPFTPLLFCHFIFNTVQHLLPFSSCCKQS
jgi:hypothetical protein